MRTRPCTRTLAIAVGLSAACAAPAAAAGPNSTLLLSRPSGLGALPPVGDGPASLGGNAVSADGRLIVFTSQADDLGVGDGLSHVWVRDTISNTTTLVDRLPQPGEPAFDGNARNAAISRDGSTVCFLSNPTEASGEFRVFVVTLANGEIDIADRASGSLGAFGNLSADRCDLDATGARVVFDSNATNLVVGDTNGMTDVFVRDRGSNTTTRVSVTSAGAEAPQGGRGGVISGDGLDVAFEARDALIPGDTNFVLDVYVRNTQADTLVRASVATGGIQATQGPSSEPAIDDTGRYVAFSSLAANLVGDDTNSRKDVFWRDLVSDTTILVSRATTGAGAPGDENSERPAISGDGVGVTFESAATNLGEGAPPSGSWVYLRRLGTNVTSLLSRATGAAGAAADAGASAVSLGGTPTVAAWLSPASNLDPDAPGEFPQVFKRDLSGTATTSLVSRPTGTAPRSSGVNGSSIRLGNTVSADGRLVVFLSDANALDPAGVSIHRQAFVRDVAAGTTTLVSRGPGPAGATADDVTFDAVINAAGTHVAFLSQAGNLLFGVGGAQLYVRDLETGTLALASRADGPDGEPMTDPEGFTLFGLSADGTRVAFSTQSELTAADTNPRGDVYVRDIAAGTTPLASVAAGGGPADGDSFGGSLSADGTRVAFTSMATNLLVGESTTGTHAYVRDLVAGTTVLADRTTTGEPGTGNAQVALMSGSGTRVALLASAALGSDPVGTEGALYVRDLESGTTILASRADGAGGAAADNLNQVFSVSHDGTRVSFTGEGPTLPGGGTPHVYVRDLTANTTRLASAVDGTADTLANRSVSGAALNAGGGCVAFTTNADNLTTPGYGTTDFPQVYLRVVDGECPVGGTTPTTTTSTTLPPSARTPIPINALVVRPGKFAKLVAKRLTLVVVDPRINGGTLDFSGTTGRASYALPASDWKAIGRGEPKGFRFDGAACRVAMLRKKIKAVCRGETGGLRLPEPGPVGAELTLSGETALCAVCGGKPAGKAAKVFKRKRCPAPATCGG
jgi:Tol biopolymer transport system component